MTLRRRWGSLTIFFALFACARANSDVFRLAGIGTSRSEAIHSEALRFLDPLQELALEDLYPESWKDVKHFEDAVSRGTGVEEALGKISNPDLRDYLLAYEDSSRSPISEFVETASRPHTAHSYIFKMTAIKILLDYTKNGRSIKADVAQIYRSIPPEKTRSSLGYVLKAENALVCAQRGLPLAREYYRECVSKYPGVPSLWNREAYLFESSGGVHQKGSKDEVLTSPIVSKAIGIRKTVRKRFPRYEPNYFYLAGDYKAGKEPVGEREVLHDYFKRFNSGSAYYSRCKALAKNSG